MSNSPDEPTDPFCWVVNYGGTRRHLQFCGHFTGDSRTRPATEREMINLGVCSWCDMELADMERRTKEENLRWYGFIPHYELQQREAST